MLGEQWKEEFARYGGFGCAPLYRYGSLDGHMGILATTQLRNSFVYDRRPSMARFSQEALHTEGSGEMATVSSMNGAYSAPLPRPEQRGEVPPLLYLDGAGRRLGAGYASVPLSSASRPSLASGSVATPIPLRSMPKSDARRVAPARQREPLQEQLIEPSRANSATTSIYEKDEDRSVHSEESHKIEELEERLRLYQQHTQATVEKMLDNLVTGRQELARVRKEESLLAAYCDRLYT